MKVPSMGNPIAIVQQLVQQLLSACTKAIVMKLHCFVVHIRNGVTRVWCIITCVWYVITCVWYVVTCVWYVVTSM